MTASRLSARNKLGDALVELTQMANPPQVFVGGSDGLAMVTTAVEARLKDMCDWSQISLCSQQASDARKASASNDLRRRVQQSGYLGCRFRRWRRGSG